MEWVGSAYITLLVLTEVVSIVLLTYTLRRHAIPGAIPLALMIGMMMLWSGVMLAEFSTMSVFVKLSFFNLRQIAVVAMPVAWLVLAYEVYSQSLWRRRGLLALLSVVPVITLLLGFTQQPIIRQGMDVVWSYGLRVVVTERGPWVTISILYIYALYIVGIILVLDTNRRSSSVQRPQTRALLAGIGLIVAGGFSDLLGVNPISPLSSTGLMLLPASLCFTWGLYRYGLLDVLPVAHDRVLEAVADGVMVVNGIGVIVDLNRAARDIFQRAIPGKMPILGRSAVEALAAWPGWNPIVPETRSRFEVILGQDGTRTIYEVDVSTLTTPRGSLLGQVLLINDVTGQREAFELAAERERVLVLQRFIRDASHDLRTPMSVIQSSSYLMKRLSDKQIENLAMLHPKLPQVYAAVIENAIDVAGKVRDRAVAADEAAKRLWLILSGMIELAELESADALEKTAVDFNMTVETVLKSRRLDSERHGVELTYTLAAAAPLVQCDERRLSRAIDAVVLNALQYTPEGGKVRVLSEVGEESISVMVSDNGMGIGPEDLPRVFERFFRADRARSTETGGAGLGLSLAKRIMEAHGGQIVVDSILGIGSTVRLLLPLEKPAGKA